jgi:hypothetical protein
VLPVIAYLAEAASGLMLALRSEAAWRSPYRLEHCC